MAVFEPNLSTKELGKWRVHSGFSVNLHQAVVGETGIGEIQAVDYVKGKERSSLSLSLSLEEVGT